MDLLVQDQSHKLDVSHSLYISHTHTQWDPLNESPFNLMTSHGEINTEAFKVIAILSLYLLHLGSELSEPKLGLPLLS